MQNFLPPFSQAHILILGDLMLDRYWHGEANRISPEAPVPIVRIGESVERPGGAGNVALNVQSIGAQAYLLGVRGEDSEGDILEKTLNDYHIHTFLKKNPHIPTITKLRILSQHQQLIRLDFEKTIPAPQTLMTDFEKILGQCQAVILSDYGKGTISDPQPYIQAAYQQGIPVLIDPKGHDFIKYRGATLLTPNRKEFETVVGPCADENTLITKGKELLDNLQIQALLITLGAEGMILISDNPPLKLQAKAKEVFDVTGAGDTVIAILGAALAAGASLIEATRLANDAASIVVSKMGAATVSLHELEQIQKIQEPEKLCSQMQLKSLILEAKNKGEKIVMTNGCFDILHLGHVNYLKAAKALGDRLIIAVNDDASIKKLKGNSRPLNPLSHRLGVLAGLACVDWLIPFSEDTPEKLINAILPDILVKGGDYAIKDIAGAEAVFANGGEVLTIPLTAGCSTTKLIQSIQEKEV